MTLGSSVDLVRTLADRGGRRLDQADLQVLASTESLRSVGHDPRVESTMKALFLGFFDAAADGATFVPRERIQAQFGRTLEQNYPEASAEFLRMAYSYWTLKVAYIEARESGDRSVAWQLLAELESTIASRFFPAAGPVKLDPKLREAEQRRALAAMAPRINIDAFIRGNPILLRDRKAASTGCIIVFVLITAATITSCLAVAVVS